MKPVFFVILLLSGWGYRLAAQLPAYGSPSIVNYSKSDYHGGTQNWAILQDGRGVVYCGNNKGILEFDGAAWNVYALPNRTVVRSLAIGEDGVIYVGGQDEMGYLTQGGDGTPRYASLTEQVPEGYRSFEDVWQTFPSPEGVFFCTQRTIFLWKGDSMQLITPPGRLDGFFQLNGRLYVRDTERGLMVWDGRRLAPAPGGGPFKDEAIAALLPFRDGRGLLVSAQQGLFLMDEQGIRPWEAEANRFLSQYRAFCAAAISGGRYAVGTTSNGLLIIGRDGRPLTHINKSYGLQNNTILSIHEDPSLNLWLGLDNGIDYVELNAPFSIISSEQGVDGTGYASIVQNETLYMGTNQGLFYTRWRPQADPFNPPQFQMVEGTKGQVWGLADLGGQLIVCHHEGLFYLDGGKAAPFSPVKGAWKFMVLNAFPDYALVGAYTGLYLFEKQDGRGNGPNWKFLHKLDGFNESARVFEQDKDGNIWVSHAYKGLYRIRLDMEAPGIAETSFFNTRQGLPGDLFINVSKIRGELVFTTTKGVYYYDEASGRFREHEELSSMIGKGKLVHRMLEDEMGNIWFSAGEDFGLLKVRETGLFNEVEQLYFSAVQEILVDGFEHVFSPGPNNAFIATERGFIQYNPSSSGGLQRPFQALIRKVSILGGRPRVVWGGGVGGRPGQEGEPPALSYKENSIRFSFAAPFFEENRLLCYRYRLEGFDSGWSEWSGQVEKDYTNLPHGDYIFRVQARNAYAALSEPAAYAFTISPPWYLTVWAKLIYVFLALLFMLSVFRYMARRMEKQKNALQAEQARELEKREAAYRQEVEQSEAEIVRLRNEKLRADIQHKTTELASATMHLVQKGEMLLEIKNSLNKLLPNAAPENRKKIRQLVRAIDEDIRLDDNWERFEIYFDHVHENFLKRLREKYPVLTPKDHKLCAYLRMNLSTKEIAPLMNISVRGVEISRYRLRKKLGLDPEANLVEFIMGV